MVDVNLIIFNGKILGDNNDESVFVVVAADVSADPAIYFWQQLASSKSMLADVDDFKDALDDINLVDFNGKILGDDDNESVFVATAANKPATPAIPFSNDKVDQSFGPPGCFLLQMVQKFQYIFLAWMLDVLFMFLPLPTPNLRIGTWYTT